MTLAIIPLDKIQVPESRLSSQLDPEQMEGLTESINRLGLINPISVKEQDGQYILIAGMNRLIALNALGKKTVPAFVYTGDDTPVDVINISENLHRGNTNPLDEAEAIRNYILRTETGPADAAKVIGRSENWVKGRLELLSLTDDLQADLKAKRLSIAICQQLAYVQDSNLRRQIATRAIDYSASAKTVKQWVDTILGANLSPTINIYPELRKENVHGSTDLILDCQDCGESLLPHQLESVLLCTNCKVKMSNRSRAGTTVGNPGPDKVT